MKGSSDSNEDIGSHEMVLHFEYNDSVSVSSEVTFVVDL